MLPIGDPVTPELPAESNFKIFRRLSSIPCRSALLSSDETPYGVETGEVTWAVDLPEKSFVS